MLITTLPQEILTIVSALNAHNDKPVKKHLWPIQMQYAVYPNHVRVYAPMGIVQTVLTQQLGSKYTLQYEVVDKTGTFANFINEEEPVTEITIKRA